MKQIIKGKNCLGEWWSEKWRLCYRSAVYSLTWYCSPGHQALQHSLLRQGQTSDIGRLHTEMETLNLS